MKRIAMISYDRKSAERDMDNLISQVPPGLRKKVLKVNIPQHRVELKTEIYYFLYPELPIESIMGIEFTEYHIMDRQQRKFYEFMQHIVRNIR